MIEFLQQLNSWTALLFVVSSMLAMGMSQRFAEVVAPLKNPRFVLSALLVNFIVSPALALGLCRLIPLQSAHAIGLIILACAAGAPFLPKLAEAAGGNVSYSVGLMVLQIVGSVLFMPLALPLLVPGLEADSWRIAKPLLLTMLMPLGFGFALALIKAPWVARLARLVERISNLALVLVLILLVGLNVEAMLGIFGSFAVAAFLLHVGGMVVVGYLLGGTEPTTRSVFALGAGQRNIVAALVIAGTGFDGPAVAVMVLIASLIALLPLLGVARVMRGRLRAEPSAIH
ncbi:MAG TPA: bile acid:sodium symporter [Xanthomonadales bacterium]|nr:bile acid:sodium symporter [Xanthomonadales bacterium]